jgi:hypothetical protein
MNKSISEELAELIVNDEDNKAEAPDSQPENTEEATAPSQEEQTAEETKPEDSAEEKALPFHKHPRWIRNQNELKEAREAIARLSEAKKEVPETTDEKLPAEFVALYGENVEAYKAYAALQEKETRKFYEAQRAKEKAEETRQTEFQTKAVAQVEETLSELAEETGIDFTNQNNTERNQILSICEKYGLFDANGIPNVSAANELREVLYPKTTEDVEEKKSVLKKTNVKNTVPSTKNEVQTHSSLKNKSMAQYFN